MIRKQFITLAAVTAMLAASIMPVQAQIKYGLKGGINLTSPSSITDVRGFEDVDIKGSTGWFVGTMAEFTIPFIGIGIDAATLFGKADSRLRTATQEETIKQLYLDIPINLKYTMGLGSLASVFIAAGPQFSLNLSGNSFEKAVDRVNYAATGFADNETLQKSVNVAVGIKLLNKLQMSAGYNIALDNGYTFHSINDQAKGGSKNNMFKMAVAVIF